MRCRTAVHRWLRRICAIRRCGSRNSGREKRGDDATAFSADAAGVCAAVDRARGSSWLINIVFGQSCRQQITNVQTGAVFVPEAVGVGAFDIAIIALNSENPDAKAVTLPGNSTSRR